MPPPLPDRPLSDPALQPALDGIAALLRAHEPFPALAVDRKWDLIAANGPVTALLDGIAAWLRGPPLNVLRASLHPDGIAGRIRNYAEWRAHLLHRLRRQFADTADPEVGALIDELAGYPAPRPAAGMRTEIRNPIAVPFELETPTGLMTFVSTTMVFGAPNSPALAEIAIETFLPADEATMAALRRL